jgi:hypothetical protein
VSGPRLAGDPTRCGERLERAVADACEREGDWPSAVSAGIRAALELAAADPASALVLTERASSRWREDEPEFVALVDRLAALLSRGAPPRNPRLPDARAVVARIAMQVNLELEAGQGRRLTELAPDLTFLALMPYVGFAGARRGSQSTATA